MGDPAKRSSSTSGARNRACWRLGVSWVSHAMIVEPAMITNTGAPSSARIRTSSRSSIGSSLLRRRLAMLALGPVFGFVGIHADPTGEHQEPSNDEAHGDDEDPDREHEISGVDELASRFAASGNDDERRASVRFRNLQALDGFLAVPLDETCVLDPLVPHFSGQPFGIRLAP